MLFEFKFVFSIGAMIPIAIRRGVAALFSSARGCESVLESELFAAYGSSFNKYIASSKRIIEYLTRSIGLFPDDVVHLALVDGRLTARDVIAAAETAEARPTPHAREIIRRTIIECLLNYSNDRRRILEVALAVELSCFAETVRLSSIGEDPPRRQWDSPAFVGIYSSRCGAVLAHLDPSSATCRRYGATLAVKLLSGEFSPALVGAASEVELCPQATEAERAEIARRSGQKVQKKESNLFRCPFCGARRSEYREVQRRCADEAADFDCFCLNCLQKFTGRS